MGPFVGPTQPFRRHVRVDLGRGQARVPEQLLDCPKVSAALKQVGGGTVPQPMGRQIRCPVNLPKQPMNDLTDLTRIHPTTATPEK